MLERVLENDYMDYETMGKRIKEIRIKKCFTQEELAEKTGLSSAHISNIETAHTKVSLTSLVAIANALEVSLDEIVRDSLVNMVGAYSDKAVDNLSECTIKEVRIINDTLDALKKSLIKNRK